MSYPSGSVLDRTEYPRSFVSVIKKMTKLWRFLFQFFDDTHGEKKMMRKGCCCFGEKVGATQEYERQLEVRSKICMELMKRLPYLYRYNKN